MPETDTNSNAWGSNHSIETNDFPETETRYIQDVIASKMEKKVVEQTEKALLKTSCSGVITTDAFRKVMLSESLRANTEVDTFYAQQAPHDNDTAQASGKLIDRLRHVVMDCASKSGWHLPNDDTHSLEFESGEPALIKQHVRMQDFL